MSFWTPRIEHSTKPRYLAIADALAQDIRDRVLLPGDRLPPQRRLAEALGIDFTTVSRGYTEALKRGLVESHVGRGTFVRAPKAVLSDADDRRAQEYDQTMNAPPEPTDPELLDRMRDGLRAVSANLVPLLRYQSPTGGEQDKEAASSWLSIRGMVPNLDRIGVTPGAHATMLAVLCTLARPGDTVLCEEITYAGLKGIAAKMGLNLVGLPMDDQGILPCALTQAIAAHQPKALYLNPTLHNPTTLTIPHARRLEIAEVVNRHGLPLIEDDAYGFIPPDAPAPLATSAPEHTWHIGGLAKCIGAGLRLAYTVAPNNRAAFAMESALRATSVMSSPMNTALATRWVLDGTADQIRRFIRTETAARQEMAAELLSDSVFQTNEHAFNIWLRLPDGVSTVAVLTAMSNTKLGLVPFDAFAAGARPSAHLRVCLGGPASRDELRRNLLELSNRIWEIHSGAA